MLTWKQQRKDGKLTLSMLRNGRETGFMVYNWRGCWHATEGSGIFDRRIFAIRNTRSTAQAIAEKQYKIPSWRR